MFFRHPALLREPVSVAAVAFGPPAERKKSLVCP
jgi:hypothetical protein